jgi:hypothetical protein
MPRRPWIAYDPAVAPNRWVVGSTGDCKAASFNNPKGLEGSESYIDVGDESSFVLDVKVSMQDR